MSQNENTTRLYRFIVNNHNNLITCALNYSLNEESLGNAFRFYTIEVPTSVSFEPGQLVGKMLTEEGELVDPPEDFSYYTWDDLRAIRDEHLASTDWTQVPDVPLSAEKVMEFSIWRQQLRDLPQTAQTVEEARVLLQTIIESKP